jgi:DNA polymerase (family 10)
MINLLLAKHVSDIADLLELEGDNPFRIRAFRRASQVIESYPEDFALMSRDQRLTVPGIGKGMADIIEEFVRTKNSKEFHQLQKKYPVGVFEMMKIPGVGPKRTAYLFRELQIDSVNKLVASAKQGILKTLPGFGEKIEKNIITNVAFAQVSSQRMLISTALNRADQIRNHLLKAPFIDRLELAGSARRWKETVGDLDFLCMSVQPEKSIAHFLKFPGISKVLGSGSTKASILLENGFQCDFRVVRPESFGAALLYFTGSKEHNVRLRELAIKKGLTLNEYGLFKINDEKKEKPLAGRTEEEVYKKLGLPWIPPEIREDRGEIEAALKNKLPNLIEMKDIKGDFHNHTTLSDGSNTLEEMITAAHNKGWKWFFSADHSPSLKIASGLSVDKLRKKIHDVEHFDQQLKDMRVFTSSEVDILSEGDLDYSDDVLEDLDCVIASVHTRFNQDEKLMTERICKAIQNRHVDILGHLSGRLISRRPSYALDYEAVFQTAKETETAIEINGQPDRQELNDVMVRRAIELRIPLALTTDAHSIQDLDNNMEIALHIARRGWAEPRNIINTFNAKQIQEWLS